MRHFGVLGLVLLVGCVTPQTDGVQESLDEDTGVTITRLAAPVELLSTAPRPRGEDPFAYLAPFEVNRMGKRQMYLWVATPVAAPAGAHPGVTCGSSELRPAPVTRDVAELEWRRAPYRLPGEWSTAYYYEIDTAWLACLAGESRLAIEVGEPEPVRFAAENDRTRDLQDFAARINPRP